MQPDDIYPLLSDGGREILDEYDRISGSVTLPRRPRLLVTESHLVALRDAIQQGTLLHLWEEYQKTVQGHAATEPIPSAEDMERAEKIMSGVGKNLFRFRLEVTAAAFNFLITREEHHAEKALEWMRRCCDWHNFTGLPHTQNENMYDDSALETSTALKAMAVGYDVFGVRLTDWEKHRLLRRIRRLCDWITLISYENAVHWACNEPGNWTGVVHSGLGMAGLAVWEEEKHARKWVRQALFKCLRYLECKPKDGACYEGVGYWAYGIGETMQFLDALKNTLGIDGFRHWSLEKTRRFPMDCLGPDACDLVKFNDSGPIRNNRVCSSAPARKLAAEYQDREMQWAIEKSESRYEKRTGIWIYDVLWTDPHLKANPPSAIDGSHSRLYPEVGWALCRSGWDGEDLLLAFKSSPWWWGHGHADQNSFEVLGFGETLLTDSAHTAYYRPLYGQYFVQSHAHNTILIGDRGQIYDKDHFGSIEAFISTPKWDRVVGQAAGAYPDGLVKSFKRELLFVKPHLIILRDQIQLYNEDHVTWLFHPKRIVTIQDRLLEFRGERSGLNMAIVQSPEFMFEKRKGYEWTGSDENTEMEREYAALTTVHKTTAFEGLFVMSPWTPEKNDPPFIVREDGLLILEMPEGKRFQVRLTQDKLVLEE